MGGIFAKIGIAVLFHLSEDVHLGEQNEKFKSTKILFSEAFFFRVSFKGANTSLKIKVHVIFILSQLMFR